MRSDSTWCVYKLVTDFISVVVFFFQAEDGIRDLVRSRGLGDVYKRQDLVARFELAVQLVQAGVRGHHIQPVPRGAHHIVSVSYTHLTLPTIYSV